MLAWCPQPGALSPKRATKKGGGGVVALLRVFGFTMKSLALRNLSFALRSRSRVCLFSGCCLNPKP